MRPVLLPPLALLLLGLLALLAAPRAGAQDYPLPPPPAAPRPLGVKAPAEQTLANGLRVVVAERRGLPLVTAELLVLSGAEADPPGRAGLASITAGLLTRGTRRHSAPQQAAAAEALGGSLDSGAGWHQSTVAITVATPQLDAALALVAEAATQPAFQQAEIDRLRAEALDELKVAYARPGTVAALAATHMLFGAGSYGHPASGTAASLALLTRADVQQLHRQRYRPDNAVLLLAGDIDLAQAVPLARRHFGAWAAPAAPLPHPAAPAGAPSVEPLTVVDMGADAGQAGVVIVLPLPAAGGADAAVGEITNAVLGGGYSSRLNLEIRIKRGLSYGAGSAFDERRGAGLLRASVQTKNESAAEVLALLQTQIDTLADAPVPEPELAARKASRIGDFSRSVETTAGLAAQVAALAVAGRPGADLARRIDALGGVSAADVQRYARSHFAAGGRRAAVAGDARQFEPALKAMVPGLVSVREGGLDLDR